MTDPNIPIYDTMKSLWPELSRDPAAQQRANLAHQHALARGLQPGTQGHAQYIKWAMGRTSANDRDVKDVPVDELPQLTPAQKKAADEIMHGDYDGYARQVLVLNRAKAEGRYRRER